MPLLRLAETGYGKLIAVACSSALFLGCDAHKHTAAEFNFVTTNTTLQQIIDRVGRYDRVRGSGILYYQWNLSDGSAILVATEGPFQQTNKVTGFHVYPDARSITLSP